MEAAIRHNTVDLFRSQGVQILRNVETAWDVIKNNGSLPDLGASLLQWRGMQDPGPAFAAFRAALQYADGLWWDNEWQVWNLTKFPLTAGDRTVAAMMLEAGMLHSIATLDDNTPAGMRPDQQRTDYYALRCTEVALLQRMYFAMCRSKFPCGLLMPYSTPPTAVQRDSLARLCIVGSNGAAARAANASGWACTKRAQNGTCVEACGYAGGLSACEALGVDWTLMVAPDLRWPPAAPAPLPAAGRGWAQTYYWPVALPPSYANCSLFPQGLAWTYIFGVNHGTEADGSLNVSAWRKHIYERAVAVRKSVGSPAAAAACDGGFGLAMYTSFYPGAYTYRARWQEKILTSAELRRVGLTTSAGAAPPADANSSGATLLCRSGAPPIPRGCDPLAFMNGDAACAPVDDHCQIDYCFACSGELGCEAAPSEHACEELENCAWTRRDVFDC